MKEIKKQIREYRDYWGLEIHYQYEIKDSTTYKELGEILDMYHNHIEGMANDAQAHLARFRKQIGLDEKIDQEEEEIN